MEFRGADRWSAKSSFILPTLPQYGQRPLSGHKLVAADVGAMLQSLQTIRWFHWNSVRGIGSETTAIEVFRIE